MNELLAIPETDVSVRDATLADVAFIDALQKTHAKMVGFMPGKQLEEKISAGNVLVAENAGERVGYCIGQDRYFKHDDVGIIYQLNVVPGVQRKFVGATLLKAMFDRAAYGCRLFCCWCAQDIEANRFWESMGFVPLAYRAGSEKKARVHVFWQKRIRAGDNETPWWFPAKTDAGAMRADRIVLPIPPGKHWADEMPVLIPTETAAKALPDRAPREPGTKAGPLRPTRLATQFGPPGSKLMMMEPAPQTKPKREKVSKAKVKADPKLIAAARELRDRWLEHVNAGGAVLEGAGKYDVSRVLANAPSTHLLPQAEVRALPEAA